MKAISLDSLNEILAGVRAELPAGPYDITFLKGVEAGLAAVAFAVENIPEIEIKVRENT
jgi:hypothetical protein